MSRINLYASMGDIIVITCLVDCKQSFINVGDEDA